MADRTVLITGATRGIGKETARGLARLGACVVVVGRDEARGAAAAKELRETTGNSDVVFLPADLSSLAEVRWLAREVTARFDRLHVLVNNAAVVRASVGPRSTETRKRLPSVTWPLSCSQSGCCRPCSAARPRGS